MAEQVNSSVEICVCGHPTKQHDLLGTDYSHCMIWTGNQKCYCSGGVRSAVWANENEEHPSAMSSVARFFKRQLQKDRPEKHPLTGGIEKARTEGYDIVWAVDSCDRCGSARDGDLIARLVDSQGRIQRELRELNGRSILICQICEVEDVYLQENHLENSYER